MRKTEEKRVGLEILKDVIDGLIEAMPEDAIRERHLAYIEKFDINRLDNKDEYLRYKALAEKEKEKSPERTELNIKASIFKNNLYRPSKIDKYKRTDLRREIALMLMDTKFQRFFLNLPMIQLQELLNLKSRKLEEKAVAKMQLLLEDSFYLKDRLFDIYSEITEEEDYFTSLDDTRKSINKKITGEN